MRILTVYKGGYMEKVFTLAEYRRLLVFATELNDSFMLRVLDKLAIGDNGAYKTEQGQKHWFLSK